MNFTKAEIDKFDRPWLFCSLATVIPWAFWFTAGYFNEIFAAHPNRKIIQTGLLLVLAGALVITRRNFYFKKEI